MDSHQDIRVYVEEKVIKKEDEVDFMIDREEVSFYLQTVNAHRLWEFPLTCNSSYVAHLQLSVESDCKISLGILENIKRAENCIRFDFKMILFFQFSKLQHNVMQFNAILKASHSQAHWNWRGINQWTAFWAESQKEQVWPRIRQILRCQFITRV